MQIETNRFIGFDTIHSNDRRLDFTISMHERSKRRMQFCDLYPTKSDKRYDDAIGKQFLDFFLTSQGLVFNPSDLCTNIFHHFKSHRQILGDSREGLPSPLKH